MHSPIGATALREPIPRRPIHPKAAARFAARAFCALFRFPTRSVRKLQVVVALATIDSAAGEKPPLASAAGVEITLASPKGGRPPLDGFFRSDEAETVPLGENGGTVAA
jgi:hypothetical protein